MSAIITVVGLAAVMFMFGYMAFKVNPDKNSLNYALQIFFFFISLLCALMIAGTTLTNNKDCAYLLSNSTVSNNVTTNQYAWTCTASTEGTAQAFYFITVGVFSIFMMYVLIGLFYYAVDKLRESGKL